LKVVILCGGYGTRIRDVADDIPKALIPVGEYPILWHVMKYYAHWGHKDFVLCLGYKGQAIRDFFLTYEAHTNDFTLTLGRNKTAEFHTNHQEEGWKVTLAETGLKSLTGTRVYKIRKYVEKDENFMLTYGDGVGNINLEELLAFHRSHGKILTVSGVRPPGRFGELVANDKSSVIEFNEKPQATAGRISGGFFICRQEIFDFLEDREDLVFEKEPMRRLVQEGQMMMYEHNGFWQPMDTARDHTLLNTLYQKKEAPWVIW